MTYPTGNIDESIEKSFRRGEWATQAMTTMRHVRAWKQVVTFSVVHVPSNTRVTDFLSRVNARALAASGHGARRGRSGSMSPAQKAAKRRAKDRRRQARRTARRVDVLTSQVEQLRQETDRLRWRVEDLERGRNHERARAA